MGSGICGGGTAQSADITINEASLQQKITGFGVSSAWAGSYANATDPDYLWSTTTGAGLSLLRIRYGDGLAIAQAAAKAGVTVWLTPWGTGTNGSPGGADTTTQNNANGCKTSVPVLTNPQDWANTLASYVQKLKSQGVPLYAVSAENEPDSCGINQTTSYSAAQLATWIGGYLGPAMAPLGVKVMGPETQNACGFTSYYSAIQGDAAAWSSVNILASHEYGCGTLPSEPAIATANKEYWETEVDTGAASGDSPGDGIASAILTAQTMHNDLTKANLNAWHYWWMYCSNNSGCLYDTGDEGVDQTPVGHGQLLALRATGMEAGGHLGNVTFRRARERLHQPGEQRAVDRGHQQQHRVEECLVLCLRQRAVHADALRDVGQQEPGPGLCRHRLGVARDGDPLRPERDDLRRNAVEVAPSSVCRIFPLNKRRGPTERYMARNHFLLLALAAVGPALISSGCNSAGNMLTGTGGTPGSGGTVSTGGSTGTGGAGTSCPNVTACGGNLVGTWAVTSSCLKVTGNLDLSLVGAGCPSAPVTGDLQVTGFLDRQR